MENGEIETGSYRDRDENGDSLIKFDLINGNGLTLTEGDDAVRRHNQPTTKGSRRGRNLCPTPTSEL